MAHLLFNQPILMKNILKKKLLRTGIVLFLATVSAISLYKLASTKEEYTNGTHRYFRESVNNNINTSTAEEKTVLSSPASLKNQQKIIKASVTGAPKTLPLYGFNGEATNAPLWSDTAYLNAASSIPFKIIRYPGGSNSNWWDWKTGSIIKQTEVAFDLPAKRAKARPRYGASHDLSDLKILVNKTQCHVVFCLNMISKQMDDQIEMLQNAQSMGIPVERVELGNEFYLYSKNTVPGATDFSDPAVYGKAANQWILAIKKVFPNVKIAVIGSTGNELWNTGVLKNAPDADAIVAHIYPLAKNILDQSGINFSRLYQSVQNKASRFYVPEKLAVWVTEYNINWKYTGKKNEEENQKIKKYSNTWGQTLATVLLTSAISTSFPLSVALNQSLPAPALDKENAWQKKPNGIGMDLWLTACSNMNNMQKIEMGMKDSDVLGWKFSNSVTRKKSYLLANFTLQDITVDLSAVVAGGEAYKTQFADKETIISGPNDVQAENGVLTGKLLKLPPYSIAIVGQ